MVGDGLQMNAELFLFIDIVKGALLRRMAREAAVVLTDGFLTPERRAQATTLYERVGDNFEEYIKGLHRVRGPRFLFVLAGNAVNQFQDNLDKCWVFAYDGHVKSINWLPTPDKTEEILNEST
jgi:hypothetical protein